MVEFISVNLREREGGQGTRHYLLYGFIVVGAIFGKPLESILGLFVAALVEF